jgi:hypothetical protein
MNYRLSALRSHLGIVAMVIVCSQCAESTNAIVEAGRGGILDVRGSPFSQPTLNLTFLADQPASAVAIREHPPASASRKIDGSE